MADSGSRAASSPRTDGESVSPIRGTRMLFRNQYVPPLGGILDCGFIKDGSGIPGKSRVLGSYALVYVAYGAGIYRDENHHVQLQPGDLITVFPELRHWYGPKPGRAFDTLHVIFGGAVFDAWAEAGLLSTSRPVTHLEPVEYWLDLMEGALGTGNHGSERRAVEEVINLQRFLSLATLAGLSGGREESWAERAKTLIGTHRDVHRVAEIFGISHETFRKKFARTVGLSPNRFATNLVMDEACTVLATENATLREVAARLGFVDEFHFSRRFKSVVGVPPSEFRARYR